MRLRIQQNFKIFLSKCPFGELYARSGSYGLKRIKERDRLPHAAVVFFFFLHWKANRENRIQLCELEKCNYDCTVWYAKNLAEKLNSSTSKCFSVNTAKGNIWW